MPRRIGNAWLKNKSLATLPFPIYTCASWFEKLLEMLERLKGFFVKFKAAWVDSQCEAFCHCLFNHANTGCCAITSASSYRKFRIAGTSTVSNWRFNENDQENTNRRRAQGRNARRNRRKQ
jgi:hypothetical protein